MTTDRRRGSPVLRRQARNPQIVPHTQLVPLAAAREVLDEASRYLGVTLPSRYAVRLAHHAHVVYANSPSFRRALARPGNAAATASTFFSATGSPPASTPSAPPSSPASPATTPAAHLSPPSHHSQRPRFAQRRPSMATLPTASPSHSSSEPQFV